MVAADDHAGAAVVLAEGGVQQTLSGTGISHVERVSALNHLVFHKIPFYQGINTFNADFRRNISGLEVAHQRMNINTVANFHGYFAKVFMGAVHGVSKLQGGHFTPAAFFKCFA